MSVLAIDAGTTGVTALVVTADGTVASRGYQEFRQYLPAARLGRAPAGRHLAGHAWRPAARRWTGPARRELHRHHEPAGDRGDLGPGHAGRAAAGHRLAGPADGGHLRAAAGRPATSTRVAALTGLRLDPYFTGTKLTWLAEHEPALAGPCADGSLAVGHRGLVPDRPADRRRPARHGRVQRVPHAAVRHRGRAVVRRAVRAASACRRVRCPRWCRPPAWSGTPTRRLPRPVAADRRRGRRPAGRAVRPGVLRPRLDTKCTYGTGSFVLANTGPADRPLAGRAAVHRGLDGRGRRR